MSPHTAVGFELAFVAAFFAGLLYVVWPTHAEAVFRVYDGADSLLMGHDGDDDEGDDGLDSYYKAGHAAWSHGRDDSGSGGGGSGGASGSAAFHAALHHGVRVGNTAAVGIAPSMATSAPALTATAVPIQPHAAVAAVPPMPLRSEQSRLAGVGDAYSFTADA